MMNMHKFDIIKTVNDYNHLLDVLTPIIEQYFETNFDDWQNYNGWDFSNNGENIVIHYSYEEFCSNADTYIVLKLEGYLMLM